MGWGVVGQQEHMTIYMYMYRDVEGYVGFRAVHFWGSVTQVGPVVIGDGREPTNWHSKAQWYSRLGCGV